MPSRCRSLPAHRLRQANRPLTLTRCDHKLTLFGIQRPELSGNRHAYSWNFPRRLAFKLGSANIRTWGNPVAVKPSADAAEAMGLDVRREVQCWTKINAGVSSIAKMPMRYLAWTRALENLGALPTELLL